MEEIVAYFENIPTAHRSFLLVGGIAFFWSLEYIVPLFRFDYRKWRHAGVNFFFTLTTIAVNFALAFVLLRSSDLAVEWGWGLLPALQPLEIGWQVLIGLLVLDLVGGYSSHLFEHKVPRLWMVHSVHHTDHEVDVTTANRHHPIESVIRFTFTTLAVWIGGIPIGIVMLYQSMSVVASQYTHANLGIPDWLDRFLSLVLVTPNMHKVHHHYKLPYTDSNYGNILSIWDRIFGTFRYLKPADIQYGVDIFPDQAQNRNIWFMLKQPFLKIRKPGN